MLTILCFTIVQSQYLILDTDKITRNCNFLKEPFLSIFYTDSILLPSTSDIFSFFFFFFLNYLQHLSLIRKSRSAKKPRPGTHVINEQGPRRRRGNIQFFSISRQESLGNFIGRRHARPHTAISRSDKWNSIPRRNCCNPFSTIELFLIRVYPVFFRFHFLFPLFCTRLRVPTSHSFPSLFSSFFYPVVVSSYERYGSPAFCQRSQQ